MDRRHFLKTLGAGAVAGTGVCGCGSLARSAVNSAPAVTTLDYTVSGPPRLVKSYTRLVRGASDQLLTLALPGTTAQAGRETRRKGLAVFVQISDLHLIDPGSPGRLAFTRQYEWHIPAAAPAAVRYQFIGAFRPQEPMNTHVLAAMVARINALKAGPVTGRALDFTVSTGDNSDSRGVQELETYLNLLGGGTVTPDPTGAGYRGLQSNRTDIPEPVYAAFWHPDPPPEGRKADNWKTRWGYPEYPGLLEAASRPYRVEGLNMRWYSGFGNHDGTDLGIYGVGSGPQRFMEYFAVSGKLPIGTTVDPRAFIAEVEGLKPSDSLQPVIDKTVTVDVPPSPKRRQFTRKEFARMHLEHKSRSGPVGHGYSQQHVEQDKLYFSFEVAPGIKGIMLDTTCMLGGEQGWLDGEQAKWLERELRAAHRRHYADDSGKEADTGNPDQLCIIFSHHTSDTMKNGGGVRYFENAPNPALKAGVDYINGRDLVALLHRFPNVVAWVNGHTHLNKITMHQAPAGRRQSGFWEINTAAHIDFPQQARIIEVADNLDGTLSLFTVLIDHSDPGEVPPPGTPANDFQVKELAAVALELAANDRMSREAADRTGQPRDRNTELLLRHPFGG